MTEAVLLFIAKHRKGFVEFLAVALVIGSIWFYLDSLYSKIEKQSLVISQLTAENTVLHDNNTKLQASLTAINGALDKVAAGADKTNKAFDGLTLTVKAQSTNLETRLRNILLEKKPQTCEDTILYLINAAKEYQK